jgi:3-hydroxy acid dehydrogenase/malonic semialdehyde reductase
MSSSRLRDQVVLITGASSGIGRAAAVAFAREGCRLALGARRVDRLEALRDELKRDFGADAHVQSLDVRDTASVDAFVAAARDAFGRVDVLLNNAGLALGLDRVRDVADDDLRVMLDTNVVGALKVARAVVRVMENQPAGGTILSLGSIAGHWSYEGGSVYCATKHALKAVTDALRIEVHGKPIRVGSIDPGMVETEFSDVRFRGDTARAKAAYAGMTPLTPEDIAECAVFMAGRPAHVNIDRIVLFPTDQTSPAVMKIHRRSTPNP